MHEERDTLWCLLWSTVKLIMSQYWSHEPRGTPYGSLILSERQPSEKTRCDRLEMWDSSHFDSGPFLWCQDSNACRRWGKILWSTVSKAALRSKSVTCWRFILIGMSFWTFRSAVSVLWPFLRADWNRGYTPRSNIRLYIWWYTARSVSFVYRIKASLL